MASKKAAMWCGWVLSVVLWTGSVSQAHAQSNDGWWGLDKAAHFGVSAALSGSAFGLAYAFGVESVPVRLAIGAGFALSLGIVKELADLAGWGEPSWKDMTWNVIGTVVGLLLAWGLEVLIRALIRPRTVPPLAAKRSLFGAVIAIAPFYPRAVVEF